MGKYYARWMCTELAGFLVGRLAKYKASRQFVFVEYFPRTHKGKIAKGALRAAEPSGKHTQTPSSSTDQRSMNAECAPKFLYLYRGFVPTAREQQGNRRRGRPCKTIVNDARER